MRLPVRHHGAWAAVLCPLLVVLSACASVLSVPDAPPPPATLTDPPRRSGKPLALIAMPDAEPFRAVRRTLVNEIKDDFDVSTHLVEAQASPADFAARLETSAPACVILMDNPTVKLYRAYQKSRPGREPVPAVVVMSPFLEELRADLQNATGIAYEVSGVTALVNLRLVIDKPVRRVGVVHRPAFRRFVQRQQALAAREQITLVPAPLPSVPTAADVRQALSTLGASGQIDALWVLNDNELLRDAQFIDEGWRQEIIRLALPVVVGIPTLVSTEAHFGTLAVLPDLDALGVQAGNLVHDLADSGWHARERAVEMPLSTVTVVNVREVRARFGLREGAVDNIDKAIE